MYSITSKTRMRILPLTFVRAILKAMKQVIAENITQAYGALSAKGKVPELSLPAELVTLPKSREFGEYTSNVALILARQASMPPLALAELLAGELKSDDYTVTTAAPGYLNFTLSHSALGSALEKILAEGTEYGSKKRAMPKKINNEFISANPTGPLHVGNARGGYFGDSVTRLLRKMGHQVTSEYYVNDGGEQITKLGHSVLQDSEAVYGGEYIEKLAEKFKGTESVEAAGAAAATEILNNLIKPTVTRMRVGFDVWTSEKELLGSGLVARALEILQNNGHTYELEGALWLRTTDFGDDKDRVLRKSDGNYTYFASDAGHILRYLEQGVETILETFGADHHGYTKRFEAVARALGFTGEIHFTLMQLVRLEKDGQPFRMSKREGNTVTIDDLIDRVGEDVARFFFLLYSPDTHMIFDLDLAEERSQKNPVFYVQYAHARMASILEKAAVNGLTSKSLQRFEDVKERELVRELYLFEDFLERATEEYAPHRLTQYALGLADLFHSFYGNLQVIDTENKEISEHRLATVLATKIVLAETLSLLGIQAPDRM